MTATGVATNPIGTAGSAAIDIYNSEHPDEPPLGPLPSRPGPPPRARASSPPRPPTADLSPPPRPTAEAPPARAPTERPPSPPASAESGGGFLVHRDGTAVHRSQAELVDSITGAGAERVGPARSSEGGEVFRMDTPHGPMEVRVMNGVPGGGPNQGPRTVTIREGTAGPSGTGEYVHPSGARIEGATPRAERARIGHTHGQENDR
jgi:hypothetical protein